MHRITCHFTELGLYTKDSQDTTPPHVVRYSWCGEVAESCVVIDDQVSSTCVRGMPSVYPLLSFKNTLRHERIIGKYSTVPTSH